MIPVQNPDMLQGSVKEANEMNKMILLASQPGYVHEERKSKRVGAEKVSVSSPEKVAPASTEQTI